MNQDFSRTRRLIHKGEFDRVFVCGKKISKGRITARVLPAVKARLGLAISKANGNSVERNRIKRCVRHAFRTHYTELIPADIVVSFTPGRGKVTYQTVKDFFRAQLSRKAVDPLR